MTIVRVSDFGGMMPRIDEKRLPENCAVEAINCDLRGRGIKSLPAMGSNKLIGALGAVTALTKFLAQIPTVAASVRGSNGGVVPTFTPPMGNYTIVANDELWYAVFLPLLPAGNVVAGAGNVDLGFTDATADVVDAVLEEAGRFSATVLAPLNSVGDEIGCVLDQATGEVTTPPGFKQAYDQFVDGGWTGLTASPELGGQERHGAIEPGAGAEVHGLGHREP